MAKFYQALLQEGKIGLCMFKSDKLFIFNVKHTTLASIIEDRIQEGQEFFVSLFSQIKSAISSSIKGCF